MDDKPETPTSKALKPKQDHRAKRRASIIQAESAVDDKLKKSAFFRQQSMFIRAHKATKHTTSYFLATLIMGIHVLDVITDAIFAYELLAVRQFIGNGSLLVLMHLIAGLTDTWFDWVNEGFKEVRGKLKNRVTGHRFKQINPLPMWVSIPLDILHMNTVVKWFYYSKERNQFIDQPWENNDFRSHLGLESFPYMIPSLIIQTHVMMFYGGITSVQILSYIVSWIACILVLFRYFKFVSLSSSDYFYMLIKGIMSTGLRICLCALVVLDLNWFAVVWVISSYCMSFIMYFMFLLKSKQIGRDDPLVLTSAHCMMAHIIAANSLFLSHPFACNHQIEDWWLGYLVLETKLQIENSLICCVGAVMTSGQDDAMVVAALVLALLQFTFNFVMLQHLHVDVALTLSERRMTSSKLIVKHWAHFCSDMLHKRHIVADLGRKKRASMTSSSTAALTNQIASISTSSKIDEGDERI